ncbi:MAG: hypothetical protein [Olavius algarvensis Gamma 1 endosymbiont]|nr:MAG: hypothetical protein [Olavius algarvensis Gamma 1 endosymbiont]
MVDLVVRFKKPAAWADSVHIHYWNIRPQGRDSTWPGVPMDEEAGWLIHRFPGIEAASLVFNRVVPVDNFLIYKNIIRLDRPN